MTQFHEVITVVNENIRSTALVPETNSGGADPRLPAEITPNAPLIGDPEGEGFISGPGFSIDDDGNVTIQGPDDNGDGAVAIKIIGGADVDGGGGGDIEMTGGADSSEEGGAGRIVIKGGAGAVNGGGAGVVIVQGGDGQVTGGIDGEYAVLTGGTCGPAAGAEIVAKGARANGTPGNVELSGGYNSETEARGNVVLLAGEILINNLTAYSGTHVVAVGDSITFTKGLVTDYTPAE